MKFFGGKKIHAGKTPASSDKPAVLQSCKFKLDDNYIDDHDIIVRQESPSQTVIKTNGDMQMQEILGEVLSQRIMEPLSGSILYDEIKVTADKTLIPSAGKVNGTYQAIVSIMRELQAYYPELQRTRRLQRTKDKEFDDARALTFAARETKKIFEAALAYLDKQEIHLEEHQREGLKDAIAGAGIDRGLELD